MLKRALKKLLVSRIAKIYPEISLPSVKVEEPPKDVKADFSSNIAFLLAPHLAENPVKIGQTLADKLSKEPILRNVEVMGKGFLNFTFADSFLSENLVSICAQEKNLGKREENSSRKILIEFVSANPTGPLHIGHGRGAALGDSLARIYEQLGYAVKREYYVNDIGVQMEILAESVNASYGQLQGKKDVRLPEKGYQGSYIQEIAQEMIQQKREDFNGYPRKQILQGIKNDLENFRVKFDYWFSESDLHRAGKLDEVIKFLDSKNCLKEKDGALWFVGQSKSNAPLQEASETHSRPLGGKEDSGGFDEERVLRKSDGKWTYFASDITYHKEKFDRGFHSCINIWGSDHHGYVPRMKAAVASLGIDSGDLHILLYQLVSLKRGGKRIAMSTRVGTFVTLREVVAEVGVDAARFFYSMRNPNAQFEFDIDLAKRQSQENPVYYVQYAHARICSIFREAEKKGISVETDDKIRVLNLLQQPEERSLMRKLCFFEDILENSIEISSPHLIPDYLIDLAGAFHKFYDAHRVLDADPDLRTARLILLSAVRTVTSLALSLLGVSAPERM